MELTVVVPTYGRKGRVEALVDEFLAQDVGEGLEVVVVEDGSPEGPREGLRRRAAEEPRLRYLWQENAGVAAARNRGAREGRSARVLFVDDDMEVPRDFARRHLRLGREHGGAWICGPSPYVLAGRPERPIDRYRLGLERRWLAEARGGEEVELVTGANLSVDRDAFLALGGFDEQVRTASAEDYLLGIRARLARIPVVHHPDLVARHHDPVDAVTFGRRQARYAKATAELLGIDPVAAALSRRVREMAAAHDPTRPLTSAGRRLRIRLRLWASLPAPLALLEGTVRAFDRLGLGGPAFRRVLDLLLAAQTARGWREGMAAAPGFVPREAGRDPAGRTTAVVVSYNTAELLEAALASLEGEVGEVVVVDNASRDDSVARARARRPGARILANDENVGFARANNQAFETVGTDYVLLLNSDAAVRPGAVSELVAFLDRHPLAALAAGGLDGADGVAQKPARRFPAPIPVLAEGLRLHKLLPRRAQGRWLLGPYWDEADGPLPADWVWGAFVLARREAIREVGGFDEGHFMYGEDMDWCARMWKARWQVWVHPGARALHHGGRSAALTWDRWQRDARIWREGYRVMERHRGTPFVLLLRLANAFAHAAEGLSRMVRGRPGAEWRYYLATAVRQLVPGRE